MEKTNGRNGLYGRIAVGLILIFVTAVLAFLVNLNTRVGAHDVILGQQGTLIQGTREDVKEIKGDVKELLKRGEHPWQ